jgi:nucleoside-diphosphate-sugar epimerase
VTCSNRKNVPIEHALFALARAFCIKPASLALSPTSVRFLGQQITVDDSCARRELGYRPSIDWHSGLPRLIPRHLESDA